MGVDNSELLKMESYIKGKMNIIIFNFELKTCASFIRVSSYVNFDTFSGQ